MKKLFVHHPLFRLLSPLFSGTLVYLLILLINNNIGQLQEAFLGQELYVCIGLAYLIQEYARLSLIWFARRSRPSSFLLKLLLQLVSTVLIGALLVSVAMYLYFSYVLGYSPNSRELYIFNSIFAVITLIYLVLYMSHQFLYKVNTERLAAEIKNKEEIEADFLHFKKGVNPDLLFESLEALLVLMKKDAQAAEQLSDHFSAVYRYVLAKKNRELVPVAEELALLDELLALFANFHYRPVVANPVAVTNTLVVPGALLAIVERIIRSTIPSRENELKLAISDTTEAIVIRYAPEESLRVNFSEAELADLANSYRFYTDRPLMVTENDGIKEIKLPKLSVHESSTS